jgi:lycopene beta-cyclase
MQNHFDLIVVGGGASGHSLLHYLRQYDHSLSILLLEPEPEQIKEKTWCFWHQSDPPLSSLIHRSWDQLLIGLPGSDFTFSLDPYQYSCIRGLDFGQSMWKQIQQSDNITVLKKPADTVFSTSTKGSVQVGNQTYQAPYVLQSVFLPPHTTSPRYPVWQHFLGWEIETNTDVFDASLPYFMDFDTSLIQEVGFIYMLPWSKRRALVEYTVFSTEPWQATSYERRLRSYLSSRFDLQPTTYDINRVEQGKIPMMDRFIPSWFDAHRRIYNLGGMGGLTKASTGYTFLNIQRQAQHLAEAIIKNEPFPDYYGSPLRFRIYDLLLLHVITQQTHRALEVFECLFTKHSIQRVLRFLDEQSSIAEELKIMAKMPFPPFIDGIKSNLSRLIKGAF